MNNKFSENLKKIRKENNLSQEQLADELGVSRQAISKWESAVAYPEMDKIIALCDKFNLNIDDLLHNDIKEVKGEEESKKKLNKIVDDFLNFVTDSVNMFSNMTFKSKVKCLFEQAIIAIVLYIISSIASSALNTLFITILGFLPDNICYFIRNVLDSILDIFFLVASIIIIVHIFKTRYLNYYLNVKKDNKEETEEIKNNIKFDQKEDKIIIRDPKHSEYGFINGLFKFIILIVKFLLLWFSLSIIFVIVGLSISLIMSLLLYKTGLFFIGILSIILSSITISILILLLILNFVFNRKNEKKKMIWSFIISLIIFGIGCAFTFIGTLDFKISDNSSLKVETREYEMKENLVLRPNNHFSIEYVESNIENVKVEYEVDELCSLDEQVENDNTNILASVSCDKPNKMVKRFINNLNKKEITPMYYDIEKTTIYASRENIEKLKNNLDKHYNELNNYEDEPIEENE